MWSYNSSWSLFRYVLPLKAASAQVIETSAANSIPSQDSNNPDDHFIKVCYSWVQIIFLLNHSCTYSCVKRGLKVCDPNTCAFDAWERNPKLMDDLYSLNGPVKLQKLFVVVYMLDALSLVTSLWYLSTTLPACLNETHLQLFACFGLFFEQIFKLASVFDFFNLQIGLSVMKCAIIDHQRVDKLIIPRSPIIKHSFSKFFDLQIWTCWWLD